VVVITLCHGVDLDSIPRRDDIRFDSNRQYSRSIFFTFSFESLFLFLFLFLLSFLFLFLFLFLFVFLFYSILFFVLFFIFIRLFIFFSFQFCLYFWFSLSSFRIFYEDLAFLLLNKIEQKEINKWINNNK
jgi:hypothetical protein